MNLFENLSAPAETKEAEVVRVIDELVSEVGMSCVIKAFCESAASDAPSATAQASTMRAIQFILRRVISAPKNQTRLEAEIMAIGSGLLVNDEKTVTRIAEKYGVSRQAISKRAVAFCDEFGLRPSSFMRSESDRETYALTNQPRISAA